MSVSVKNDEGYLLELRPVVITEEAVSSGESELRTRKRVFAQELGLTAFAKTLTGQKYDFVAATRWCRAQGLEPISDEEYNLWRAYLPTPYWSDVDKRINGKREDLFVSDREVSQRGRDFSDYDFHEGVPLIVLERMRQTSRFFVHEIRTPELNRQDPVLFGHVLRPDGTRAIYMLARWGRDSGANFLPDINAVQKILAARTFGQKQTIYTLLTLLSLIVMYAIFQGVQADRWIAYPLLSLLGGMFCTGMLCAFAEPILRIIGKRRFAKSDPDLLPLF